MIFTMAVHFPLGSEAEVANPLEEGGGMNLANLSLVMAIVEKIFSQWPCVPPWVQGQKWPIP